MKYLVVAILVSGCGIGATVGGTVGSVAGGTVDLILRSETTTGDWR